MSKKHKLSVETQSSIFTCAKKNIQWDKLPKMFKISTSTVWSIMEKEETGSMTNQKQSVRQ